MVKSPYATQFTRTGVLDTKNKKPFRTAAQKHVARQQAVQGKDGVWRSMAPRSYH